MASKHRYKEFRDYPKYERAYKNAFAKMLRSGTKYEWKNEDEVFAWWMQDKNIVGQITIDQWLKDERGKA